MPRSVLLQLTRDSIAEVLEMQKTIVPAKLFTEHPLLKQNMATKINLYLNHELRGSSSSLGADRTLLEDIVINAKKSAFEDSNFTPITTSEYLSCELELILITEDGMISEKDPSIIQDKSDKLETLFQ